MEKQHIWHSCKSCCVVVCIRLHNKQSNKMLYSCMTADTALFLKTWSASLPIILWCHGAASVINGKYEGRFTLLQNVEDGHVRNAVINGYSESVFYVSIFRFWCQSITSIQGYDVVFAIIMEAMSSITEWNWKIKQYLFTKVNNFMMPVSHHARKQTKVHRNKIR